MSPAPQHGVPAGRPDDANVLIGVRVAMMFVLANPFAG
ncbi:MAG: hypothetical protein JWP65_3484 [Ramlibacter sp.]|jgi:hypothetical protein|nr:hypothetical protein [Ramlibacter sp.]